MTLTNRVLYLKKFTQPCTDTSALEIEALPVPECGDDEVVVRNAYACINPSDLFTIQGIYPGAKSFHTRQLPAKLGFESSGTIHQVGKNVTSYRVGQRVISLLGDACGAYSDFVVVKPSQLVAVPDKVPLDVAAQFLVNPVTVIGMLDELNVQPGQTLIQNAANSTLARMVIQLCQSQQVNTVNVVRRQEAADELLAQFPDATVLVFKGDGSEPAAEFGKRVNALLKQKGWAAVKYGLDAVGGEASGALVSALDIGGTMIAYGLQSFKPSVISNADFLFKGVTVKGFWLIPWLDKKSKEEVDAVFQKILGFFESGTMVPAIEKKYPLEQYEQAFKDELSGSARKGKLLFELQQTSSSL